MKSKSTNVILGIVNTINQTITTLPSIPNNINQDLSEQESVIKFNWEDSYTGN